MMIFIKNAFISTLYSTLLLVLFYIVLVCVTVAGAIMMPFMAVNDGVKLFNSNQKNKGNK